MEIKIIEISKNQFLVNNGIDVLLIETRINEEAPSIPIYSHKDKNEWEKTLKNNSAKDIESNSELRCLYNKVIDDIDINFETQSEFEFKKGMTEYRI